MKYVSIFSGIEAASVAWEPLEWEPLAFAEVEPYPCAVLAHRFPDVPNLGNVEEVDWKEFKEKNGTVDLVVGGSPCFTAGTLVLCEDGFKPIEQVEVGERVVTHMGRLKRVLATGSKVSDTIMLKGQGSVGIECTPNHPFFSRSKCRVWDNPNRNWKCIVSDAEWTHAGKMLGRYWLNVCNTERTEIPPLGKYGKGGRGSGWIDDFEFTPSFFYFVGRWLGDGWANAYARKNRVRSLMKRVYVCCSHDEADELDSRLSNTGLHFCKTNSGSTVRFTCSSTQLHDWLVGNFGIHADGKNIPAWCLGMDKRLRSAMLEGYLDADGTLCDNGYKSSTINRKLALGIKMLAGSCGMATSITYVANNRDAVIEGRHVNEHPNYVSSHYSRSRSAFFEDSGFYGLVRKLEPCRTDVRVYNLEVEDDNSYTADGIAVHNCQSFSVAGKREGLRGASRLMYEYIRCVQELMPSWFTWENVPGSLTVERGGAFRQLLDSMDVLGYGMAWRVLDAQFFGVAQRRRRLFLVGHLGDRRACEVLLESESLRGDTPTSKAKREELARANGGSSSTHRGSRKDVLTMSSGQANAEITTDNISPTLTCLHEAPIVFDRAAFNQGGQRSTCPTSSGRSLWTRWWRGDHMACACK